MVRQSNANMERLSLGFPYLISNKRTKLGKGQNKKKLKKRKPKPKPKPKPNSHEMGHFQGPEN